jgi:predicted DNA-binding transcriptional regulator YafY
MPKERLGASAKVSRGTHRSKFRHGVMRRQLELLRLLQSEPDGISMSEILDRFKVEDGTIYRDLKLFQAIGLKLNKERRGSRVYWRADQFRGEAALKRQWQLLRVLSARRDGSRVTELAEELEVAESTVRRDLQVLLEAGFPLTDDENMHTWRLLAGGLYA